MPFRCKKRFKDVSTNRLSHPFPCVRDRHPYVFTRHRFRILGYGALFNVDIRGLYDQLCRTRNLLNLHPEPIVLTEGLEKRLGVSHDHSKKIIEIVGNATGQPADAFEFLCLEKLAFQMNTLRNINGCSDRTEMAAKLDQFRRN